MPPPHPSPLTVWTAGADRPIFCASRFFDAQVLDLAWTSSGYGLLASSTDGADPEQEGCGDWRAVPGLGITHCRSMWKLRSRGWLGRAVGTLPPHAQLPH